MSTTRCATCSFESRSIGVPVSWPFLTIVLRYHLSTATQGAPDATTTKRCWPDPFFACPGKHATEDSGGSALGAAGGRSAVAQSQIADHGVEVGQVQVTDPGIAENRQDVNVQTGPFLGQRRLGPGGAVALVALCDQVLSGCLGEPDLLGLHPAAGAPFGRVELSKELLGGVQARGHPFDLLLQDGLEWETEFPARAPCHPLVPPPPRRCHPAR